MANVYFGDGYAELAFTATAGYSQTMVGGTVSGNQTWTRVGGVPIPVVISGGYPGWQIKATKLTSPFTTVMLSVVSTTSTTVVINGVISGSLGQQWTFQFFAFDWNVQNNWYSTIGNYSCCCGTPNYTPGTLLGRLPDPATDSVVLIGSGTTAVGYGGNTYESHIINGPTGTYSGAMTFGFVASLGATTIDAGNYSGAVNVNLYNGQSGQYVSPAILGGTYSGAVTLSGTGWIGGGTFTGSVSRSASAGVPVGKITGGTYSPSATIPLLKPQNTVNSGYPNDPGFAAGGGTFSPYVVITGVGSDILGAGLP